MIVAGVMSGTSADGVDVAICRITAPRKAGGTPLVKLLGHLGSKYPKAVRAAVLRTMNADAISVAEMSRLNWRLGEAYADAVAKAAAKLGVKVDLVACHGQTVYHQGVAAIYAGRPVRATWQTGEPAVIAERLRVPVVSDFRPADMAADGQGAPLVPMLDFTMFRDPKKSRVLLNLGGIANLTAIPAGAGIDGVMAFDTGPANMVIDACMARLFEKPMDRGGMLARRGTANREVIDGIMQDRYFSVLPPKSCGREQFGEAFVSQFLSACTTAGLDGADIIATATSLTAETVLDAYRRFVWAHLGQAAPLAKVEWIVAGGGVRNPALIRMLKVGLEPLGVKVRMMEELGVPSQAKEAIAFALLGWLTWNRMPGNVPTATGAKRPVVLGKVTLG